MNRFLLGLSLCLLVVVLSCGDGRPGNKRAYQGDTQNCSREFIDDYNRVFIEAQRIRGPSERPRVKEMAREFIVKYDGVICVAERRTLDPSNPPKVSQINAAKDMNDLISNLGVVKLGMSGGAR